VRVYLAAEGRREALKEFRQPKKAGVIVDSGSGEIVVDFDGGDFTQGEHMTEKEYAAVTEVFCEEIFVAQTNHSLGPGYPDPRG
jgi:hypothetical protein